MALGSADIAGAVAEWMAQADPHYRMQVLAGGATRLGCAVQTTCAGVSQGLSVDVKSELTYTPRDRSTSASGTRPTHPRSPPRPRRVHRLRKSLRPLR
jgi:hypothetical protein